MKKKRKKRPKWFRELLRKRLFFCFLILLQLVVLLLSIFVRSEASVVISGLLHLISVVVALHIISRRDKEAYKLTWVFFILIFPVFGGLMYLFFRCQTRSKKYSRKGADPSGTAVLRLHRSCAALSRPCASDRIFREIRGLSDLCKRGRGISYSG